MLNHTQGATAPVTISYQIQRYTVGLLLVLIALHSVIVFLAEQNNHMKIVGHHCQRCPGSIQVY